MFSSASGPRDAPLTRVIGHVDLDCFYVAVEQQRDKSLLGVPCGVVQYNPHDPHLKMIDVDGDRRVNNSNGSLIAVGYEARARGVKRGMKGHEARKVCPEIQLVQVPTKHGKANIACYIEAGAKVVDVIRQQPCDVVERASIDEVYVDITTESTRLLQRCLEDPAEWANILEQASDTKVAGVGDDKTVHLTRTQIRDGHKGDDGAGGTTAEAEGMEFQDDTPLEPVDVDLSASWWARPPHEFSRDELLLACGCCVVSRLRRAARESLGYTLSGGVAHNKMLAKLGSAMNKPNKQTVVPTSQLEQLLQELPIPRIKGMGRNLGEEVMAKLSITTIGELAKVSEPKLQKMFGDKIGSYLYAMSRGEDTEPVKERTLTDSNSRSKTFPRETMLTSLDAIQTALQSLSAQLHEVMVKERTEHRRMAKKLVAHVTLQGAEGQSLSKSCDFSKWEIQPIAETSFGLVRKMLAHRPSFGVVSMAVGTGKMEPMVEGVQDITSFLAKPGARGGIIGGGHSASAAAVSPAPAAAPPPVTREKCTGGPLERMFRKRQRQEANQGPGDCSSEAYGREHGSPPHPPRGGFPSPPPMVPHGDPPGTGANPPREEPGSTPTEQSLRPLDALTGPGDVAAYSKAPSAAQGQSSQSPEDQPAHQPQGPMASDNLGALGVDPREIDPSVLEHLPLSIRREIEASMRGGAGAVRTQGQPTGMLRYCSQDASPAAPPLGQGAPLQRVDHGAVRGRQQAAQHAGSLRTFFKKAS